jgi:tricorn protease
MIIKRLLPAVLLSMAPLIGADGDIFPYLFHLYGLGKLVGTRSWGGVRGIHGNWLLAGHDAQLEAAVDLMLKARAGKPEGLPHPPPWLPAYPANGIVPPQP